MGTVVIEYRARPPLLEGADRVAAEAEWARAYYNRRIEIERERIATENAILNTHAGYVEAQQALDARLAELKSVRGEIAKLKAEARRNVETPELDVRAEEIKARLRELRDDVKRERTKAKIANKPALEAARERAAALKKRAYNDSPAYWGTNLFVNNSTEQAVTMWSKLRKNPLGPAFKRRTGDLHLATQTQPGLSIKEAFSCQDTQLRIEPYDPTAKKARTTLRMRVGSDANKKPIWATVNIRVHRPLPDGSIKWVHLIKRMLGPHERWCVQIVVECPGKTHTENCGTGVVGLDIGWRSIRDNLRVGYAYGISDGVTQTHEFVLDSKTMNGPRTIDNLRSIRDNNFNLARKALQEWLASQESLPAWLTERTATLMQWRSQSRLASLAIAWRERRFANDADGFEPLEAWRRQDKHLWLWAVNGSDQIVARRRDQYRVWAARLARQYEILVVEDFKLTQIAKVAEQEEDNDNTLARYRRQSAGVSVLRNAMINAFRVRGGLVVFAPAKDTTRKCHDCGKICKWDQAKDLHHTCEHCGVTWDQDLNAAINLARYASAEVIADTRTALAERAKANRGGRFGRKKREKAAREQAAPPLH